MSDRSMATLRESELALGGVRASERTGREALAISLGPRIWAALPTGFAALAVPQLVDGPAALLFAVAFGAFAIMVLWPMFGASFGMSRLLFYCGLLFVGAPLFRPLREITLADWLFAASFAFFIAEAAFTRHLPRRVPPLPVIAGGVLVALGALLAAASSDTPDTALGAGLRFLVVTVAWVWLGALVLERRRHILIAMIAWSASVAFSSGAALMQLLLGDVIPGTSPSWGRMTGFSQHVNDLGSITAIALVPAAALATVMRGTERLFASALALACLGGLVLSGSLSAVIAAAVGLATAAVLVRGPLFRVLLRPRVGAGIIAVATVAMSAGSLAVAADLMPSPLERLALTTDRTTDTPLRQDQATLWRRLDTFGSSWELVKEDPLVGQGFNPDTATVADGRLVHNTVLGTWAGLGVTALIGLLLCLAAPFAATVSLLREGEALLRSLVVGLTAGAVTFTVFALSNPALYRRYGWVPLLLLGALAAERSAARRARLRGPPGTCGNRHCPS